MSWTFVYMMVFLKLPIAALLWLVWWAIHQEPEEVSSSDDDGGTKLNPHGSKRHPHHPRPRLPRTPRRGPHGAHAPASPPRVRSVVARGRRVIR